MMFGEDLLTDLSENLISTALANSDRRRDLFRQANPKIFRDEAYIIYKVLYHFKERELNFDKEFLSLYLTNNRNVIGESKQYIDIFSYGDIDGDNIPAYTKGVLDYYDRITQLKVLTEEEFNISFEKYKVEFQRIEYQKILSNTDLILNDQLRVRRKVYSGFEDSVEYNKKAVAELNGLIDMNNGKGFRSAEEVYSDAQEVEDGEIVADFHKVDELNDWYGGVYSKMMYVVLAPPKAGKSKFCTRVAHQALTKYHKNVTVWAVEGGSEAWLAQLRAIHFDSMYNSEADLMDRKFGVDQYKIFTKSLGKENPELAALEQSSYTDLVSNPSFGKVAFIDRPFEVETFLEEIDTSVKANNSSLLVIDYLQLIGSRSSQKSERERIADAFPRLLRYIKDNNLAAILPAQYSQEAVKDMLKSDDVSKMDTRVMGGGSSEIVRTTDFLIPLFATTEDIANNRVSILPTTTRFAGVTNKVELYVDGASCLFSSIKEG